MASYVSAGRNVGSEVGRHHWKRGREVGRNRGPVLIHVQPHVRDDRITHNQGSAADVLHLSFVLRPKADSAASIARTASAFAPGTFDSACFRWWLTNRVTKEASQHAA